MSTDRPDISLVIPAYNEGGYLASTLERVSEAREVYGDPSAIEVVVVDNMSTDDTAEVAAAHGATVLVEQRRCIAAVRNRGARDSAALGSSRAGSKTREVTAAEVPDSLLWTRRLI